MERKLVLIRKPAVSKKKMLIQKLWASIQDRSGKEAVLLAVLLGARPAGEHEANLVEEISNVVDHVEGGLVSNAGQEAKEVAERVDGPAKAHNQAHVAEGLLHGFAAVAGGLGGLTSEDLEQDEAPAAQAEDESRPAEAWGGLANIAEGEHEDGAEEEPPESTGGDWGLGSLQDEVELNHLHWHGDAPVNVSVHDWGLGAAPSTRACTCSAHR